MKRIELSSGTHELGDIVEPTEIVGISSNCWNDPVYLRPQVNIVINVRAPLRMSGCTITGGHTFGIKGHSTDLVPIELENCWIHSNVGQGIFSCGSLRIHRCLIEHNGINGKLEHGIYSNGPLYITNSIIRYNSGWQITSSETTNIDQSLLIGARTGLWIGNPQSARVNRCTIHTYGRKPIQCVGDFNIAESNNFTNNLIQEKESVFVGSFWQDLWWLNDPQKDGLGCYDYDERLTLDYAKKIWQTGFHYARNSEGIWDSHGPWFPGDVYFEV